MKPSWGCGDIEKALRRDEVDGTDHSVGWRRSAAIEAGRALPEHKKAVDRAPAPTSPIRRQDVTTTLEAKAALLASSTPPLSRCRSSR